MCIRIPIVMAWIALMAILTGCTSAPKIADPRAELQDPSGDPRRQIAAMGALDEESPDDPAYIEQLHGLMWRSGYTPPVRMAAFERLERRDPDGLKRTIRQRLPQMVAWAWLTDLCGAIADRGWTELTPALVSSWARPTVFVREESDRPEYKALARLHGEERVDELVFELLVESRSVAEQGLRTRCWDLLHRLGRRDQLMNLVARADLDEDDLMLRDLRAGVVELGVLPRNREEILWLRELRMPARGAFWSEAAQAVAELDSQRRAQLEMRDLAVVVSAARHDQSLLKAGEAELYARLQSRLRGGRHHDARGNFDGMRGAPERLHGHREKLTWGDLAAMLLALRAFETAEMVDHLFDYAERDRADTSTEYGGVIRLDERGRFELLEFPPRQRRNDVTFLAPQDMFDAGYTGLFHFHYHAQKHRNVEHASPGFGDVQYADRTLANCLVFTFINADTLNIDFYRHSRVIVDLGEIRKR